MKGGALHLHSIEGHRLHREAQEITVEREPSQRWRSAPALLLSTLLPKGRSLWWAIPPLSVALTKR